jgi:predicted phage terminase large subunit-like protein
MNLQVSRPEAAKELLNRRSIRRSLTEYARLQGFEPAAHHLLIIKELEAIARGETDNLLIFAPPGSAKSTYVSVLFIAWYLAMHPTHNVLFATHSVEFAQRWGRKVRNDLGLNSLVLGVEPDPSNQASDRWALKTGGEYYSVGAGVGISGFRADLAVIDDPFGSREDAWSEVVREKRWLWYVDDFSARLKPAARRVIMHTRWHEEDIAGRVLEQIKKGIIKAKVIKIPAIAGAEDVLGRKPGEYLWDDPEGYNYASYLRARQRESSAMMWSALYQQEPAPEDGDYFKSAWLKPYDEVPALETLRIYGGSDYAVTADGGDYTVHVVVGLDPEGRMYVLDLWRKQSSSDEWIEAYCDLVLKWKPIGWAEETGQIRAGVGPYLDRRANERRAFVARDAFPTRGDKAVRAQSIRGRMAHLGLYVPHRSPWYADFRSELLSFPAGKHDDQVDALGLVGQLLDIMHVGQKIADPEKPKNPSGYSARDDYERLDDWKTY